MNRWRCTRCPWRETNLSDPVTCALCGGPMALANYEIGDPGLLGDDRHRVLPPQAIDIGPPYQPRVEIPLYRTPDGQVTPRPVGPRIGTALGPPIGPPQPPSVRLQLDLAPLRDAFANVGRGIERVAASFRARAAARRGERALFVGGALVWETDEPRLSSHMARDRSRHLEVVVMPAFVDASTGRFGVTFPALPAVPPPVD